MVAISLNKQFNNWKRENGQHGRQAFSRFMMLKFLDALSALSDDFIFKGGNLLWHYIRTPRQTIDLDLVTAKMTSHETVRKALDQVGNYHSEIDFNIIEFKEIDNATYSAAAVVIGYKTAAGQVNQFSLDIVYALPTNIAKVRSTISGELYISASIENIVADKVQAAHRFKAGNTRMKDFDDLWRIAKSSFSIDMKILAKLMDERKIPYTLDIEWVDNLNGPWIRHSKMYKDIPSDLEAVFNAINLWLKTLKLST
ncbi:MAG: nucleotidyl transferase AbiEii/AbiGii toxin family protein [Bdellovibrionota bacterium]